VTDCSPRSPVVLGLLLGAAVSLASAQAHAQEAPTLFQRHGCTTCHADVETVAAPAYVDIAAKYRGNPKAATILRSAVRKGAHGHGIWPMPPLPEVPEADARKMVAYILALKAPQKK
jgi:cytochrome c551/c552